MKLKSTPPAGIRRKRILLVAEQAIVRAGLSAIICLQEDFEICGEAVTDHEAVDAVRRLCPDVILVDWSMGSKDVLKLLEDFKTNYPRTPVLVLSVQCEVESAEQAFRSGARGYVIRREGSIEILSALRAVLSGRFYFPEQIARILKASIDWNNGETTQPEGPKIVDLRKPQSARGEFKGQSSFVSIIIPVYNSQATIEPLVTALIAELKQDYRLQIVLVDDGSTDRSGLACKAIQSRYPKLVDFVSLSKNFGEHNAVMAGLHRADGDWCVIMDDDFQNPPSEVQKLLQEVRKGYDVVYVKYDKKKHSWYRNVGSRVVNWVATRALGKPSGLYLSSFKVISRFMAREAINYTGADPHLDALILRSTRKIGVVESMHAYRERGKSGYTLSKLLALWGNLVIPYSLYPLRLIGVFGVVLTFIGVCFWIYNFIAEISLVIPDASPFEQLQASLWFFRGIHSLTISILGEYVGRIYKQINCEPQFVVREVLPRHSCTLISLKEVTDKVGCEGY